MRQARWSKWRRKPSKLSQRPSKRPVWSSSPKTVGAGVRMKKRKRYYLSWSRGWGLQLRVGFKLKATLRCRVVWLRSGMTKIVFLFPAYQPTGLFPKVLSELRSQDSSAIVVVNDGSDNSHLPFLEAARKIENTTVLTHAVNLGKGAALKLGMNHVLVHLRLFQGAKIDRDLRLAAQLLDWLASWGDPNVSLPDIYQFGPNAIRDRKTALRLIGVLEKHRNLVKLPGVTTVKGERRRDAWLIVPGDRT
jgi:hypothetical protein